MIRKLRLKFIAVIMALVLVLLGVIFGLIVHFTRLDLERESVTMMQNIASILIFHLLKLKLIARCAQMNGSKQALRGPLTAYLSYPVCWSA